MSDRVFASMLALATVVAGLSLAPVPAIGQASTAAAKTWDPPRTDDGQPDIQGYWANGAETSPAYSIEERYRRQPPDAKRTPFKTSVVDPPDGSLPYLSWAAAKRREIAENHTNITKEEYVDPQTLCYLDGVPRINYQADNQLRILQLPGYVMLLYEWAHHYRVIPVDGRPHVAENVRLWMGDSRGRWEGNTLVVDVTNFNDKTWFDVVGTFHSEVLHVVERFTFVDADRLQYAATIDDPTVFARPWKIAFPFVRNKQRGYELLEHACYEGERDFQRMLLQPSGEKAGQK